MAPEALIKLANAIKLSDNRLARNYYNNTRIGGSIGKGLGAIGGGALGAGVLTSGLLANSVANEALADPMAAIVKYLPAKEQARVMSEFVPGVLSSLYGGGTDPLIKALQGTSRESVYEILANVAKANKGLTAAGIGGGLLAGGALGGAMGSGLGALGGAIATPVTSSVGYLADKLKPAPKKTTLTSILRKALRR